MSTGLIRIKGAREHNLKNISLDLPRDRFIVITGLSGSGKSTLAFDTIYAEGQRRYVESLSAYARQFLGQMEKPDVDSIEGLSPAISIEQKVTHRNPRSIVATVTEIYDYFRLLFAHIGKPFCPQCGKPITAQTSSQIIDLVLKYPAGTKIQVLSPLVSGRKGEYKNVIETVRKEGFARMRIDGRIYNLHDEKPPDLRKSIKHSLEIVVDRLVVRPGEEKRAADSVETALKHGDGKVIIKDEAEEKMYSRKLSCLECGISLPEVSPRYFSFNNPYGACPTCGGLGKAIEFDPNLIVPDPELSLFDGAIEPFQIQGRSYFYHTFKALAETFRFSLDTPFKNLPQKIKDIIFYGTGARKIRFQYESSKFRGSYDSHFEGVINNLKRRYRETKSEEMREEISQYMSAKLCPDCRGDRLKKEALSIRVQQKSIIDVTRMSVKECHEFFDSLTLSDTEKIIARDILKEIRERLGFLKNVGLDYLTLDREAGTLSGGEAQRIRLATQVGSRLVGVLYVLDEPSIGLHQKDNRKLLETLRRLQKLGNTLLVIEHDEETIRSADWVVDLGPGAGEHGGKVVAQGAPADIINNPQSLTGRYLAGENKIAVPRFRRKGNGKVLTLFGASMHNLKNIDVAFPLGKFICITGVSGSGKSTLLNEILFPELSRKLNRTGMRGGAHKKIEGIQHLDKVIDIDQSPIGRTPRSNPVTYTGTFAFIRDLFAKLPDSRVMGYKPGRFSFNVPGGRCERCEGHGLIRIEMHFLPDIYIKCEECQGRRFNRETLQVRYKNRNIADVLEMTVEEALDFFQNIPSIRNRLGTLEEVGLGYIRLGQSATTLSGGEAQRIKLATELSRRSTGKTLYILDEPTTGLHFDDVKKLLAVLERFVDNGNTVIVIEHNLDVIKVADHIIDLGPEGGDNGGRIVAEGTPDAVAAHPASSTGEYLKKALHSQDRP